MTQKERGESNYLNRELFFQSIEKAILEESKRSSRPVTVCIGGPSAAGKSSFADELIGRLPAANVLHMDSYLIGGEEASLLDHKSTDPRKPFLAAVNPQAFDIHRMQDDYVQLLDGKTIHKPVFDKQSNKRVRHENFGIKGVLLLEGLYALNKEFVGLANFGIYVDASLHERLMRKITRNVLEYKRTNVSWIISEYLDRGEPAFQFYAESLKKNARYVFRNNGRAAVQVPGVDVPIDLDPGSKNWILYPKQDAGNLHRGEKLIISIFDGESFLLYCQDGQMLLKEPISESALRSLSTAYVARPLVD